MFNQGKAPKFATSYKIMPFQKYLYAVLFFSVCLATFYGGTGCANIIPPTGGPRDSLPPVLIQVSPPDSTLNFTNNRIVFSFNEFVDVQNLTENLIVSPTPKLNPVVDYKLRTVTVKIKDTLEPRTTYSLNFGNAIRDINEGNVLKNFTYVFSTGPRLDDKQVTGNVILAESGKIDSTLTVMLHRSDDDSAVIKERPRYYTRVDASGRFTFQYLPEGTFYLYALKDEGGSRRYLSPAQLFAFADKPVNTADTASPVTLYAYSESEEEPQKPAPRPAAPKKEEDKRLKYTTNLESRQLDLLGNLELNFITPLKTFDSTKISFTDSTFSPLGNYTLLMDSLKKQVSLAYNWKPGIDYKLILQKDFAEDTLGRKLLKIDTISFQTKAEAEYGSLRIRFRTLDLTRNPVLLFVQGEKVVKSFPFTTNQFYNRLFIPGEYELRILYDENRNGKWDPGAFFGKHKQPEKVLLLNRKVTVKGNWDKDETIE
jgi:hypothetical protein